MRAYCLHLFCQRKLESLDNLDTLAFILTTDQALTNFQREEFALKDSPPVAISPSQLLQLFNFSKPVGGYEETFVKFFASSSLGITFSYSNEDIQEILSRIGHYEGINPGIAERVLQRELINSRYFKVETDTEREEIVYKDISNELLEELNSMQTENFDLCEKQKKLDSDYHAAIDLLYENADRFSKETSKLQLILDQKNQEKNQETATREKIKKERDELRKHANTQERIYVDEKWQKWRKQHLIMLWTSVIFSILIVGFSLWLSQHENNSGYFGLLSLLAIPLAILPVGNKVYSVGIEAEIRDKILAEYHRKLKKTK